MRNLASAIVISLQLVKQILFKCVVICQQAACQSRVFEKGRRTSVYMRQYCYFSSERKTSAYFEVTLVPNYDRRLCAEFGSTLF
jgi:hypothetical protein